MDASFKKSNSDWTKIIEIYLMNSSTLCHFLIQTSNINVNSMHNYVRGTYYLGFVNTKFFY